MFFVVRSCSFFRTIIFCSNVVLVWTFNARIVYSFITNKANIPVNLVPFFNGSSFLSFGLKSMFFWSSFWNLVPKTVLKSFSWTVRQSYTSLVVWIIFFTSFIYWANKSLAPGVWIVSRFHNAIKQSLEVFKNILVRALYHLVCGLFSFKRLDILLNFFYCYF